MGRVRKAAVYDCRDVLIPAAPGKAFPILQLFPETGQKSKRKFIAPVCFFISQHLGCVFIYTSLNFAVFTSKYIWVEEISACPRSS